MILATCYADVVVDTLDKLQSMLVMDLDGNFVSVNKNGDEVKLGVMTNSSGEVLCTVAGEQIVTIVEGQV